jgi:SSS family solute:Na+ symporter
MKDSAFVLSPLDTVIIAASLIFVVLVGLWAGRGQSKTARGYFLASDRLPWWIIGSAFVSTSVSSEQIVGTVGAAYQHGMAIANWEWWCLPTYTLLLLRSYPGLFEESYCHGSRISRNVSGRLCGDIYSWVMLVRLCPGVLSPGSLRQHARFFQS